MKIRMTGTEDECLEAAGRLAEVFDVVDVSSPYRNRPPSQLVRVYAEVRLGPPATFVPSVQVAPDPPATPRRSLRAAPRRNQ